MLDLTLLGSGGGIPIPERHLSSVMINYRGRNILIDVGEGTQVAMRRFHTGFRSLDIICLSHFHGDHIFGLPGLLSTLSNSNRRAPITIIGPVGLKKVMEGLLISLEYLNFQVKLIENPKEDLEFSISKDMLCLKEDKEDDVDIILSTLELEHSSPCLGYRFYLPRNPKFHIEKAIENNVPKNIWSKLQSGKTVKEKGKIYKADMVLGEERRGIKISFVTDTRPVERMIHFIKESDLFICEGSYGDDNDLERAIETTHMTFREAASLAKKGQVKRLLLTHFSARMEDPSYFKKNAKEVFENTVVGFDGYRTSVSYED